MRQGLSRCYINSEIYFDTLAVVTLKKRRSTLQNTSFSITGRPPTRIVKRRNVTWDYQCDFIPLGELR
jgi:hypothetical protein